MLGDIDPNNPHEVEDAIKLAIIKTAEWDIFTAPPVITKIQFAK